MNTGIWPHLGDEQQLRIEAVKCEYDMLTKSLKRYCMASRELSVALTNLETSMLWAVKAIAEEVVL